MKNTKMVKIQKKKKKNKFLIFLFTLTESIAKFFKRGPIGYFFSDLYTDCNEKWKDGFIYNLLKRKRRKAVDKATIAHLYEESYTSKNISGIVQSLLHSNLRIWGISLLFFAISVLISTMLHFNFTNEVTVNSEIDIVQGYVLGTIVLLLALPLVLSKKELGEGLMSRRFTRFIVLDVLNLNPTHFEKSAVPFEGSYLIAILFSVAIGFCSYFVSPLTIISVALIFTLFVLVVSLPELGMMLLIVLLPFANIFPNPSIAVLIILSFAICGFISKILRGKRILRFELIEVMVLAFGILLLFGGIFSIGGSQSLYSAELYFAFLLVYFLVVNMYIGKPSIYRALKVLIVTSTIVALLAILRGGGDIHEEWVDFKLFEGTNVIQRVDAFLGNPNMLGIYLVLAFPFAIGEMVVSKRFISKLMYFISAAIIFVCTVMTWSRGAWLGMVASTAVFLLLYNFKNIWLVILSGLTLPIWHRFLPSDILKRFTSIFLREDSSIQSRIKTWEAVELIIKDHWFAGVGVGDEIFLSLYGNPNVDIASLPAHTHSLYLQILVELGIVGLLVFLGIMFVFGQKCMVEVKKGRRSSKSRTMIVAGFSAVLGACVAGLTDYIWYNYRLFLTFWLVLALTVALVKANIRERESEMIVNTITSANLEINR